MTDATTTFTQRTKELRLAVVCYGGVSLAVYEHGVTKELYKLVRAARAFEAAQDGELDFDAAVTSLGLNPADPAHIDSERAYFAALTRLAGDGHPLTVSVDVISGTSAGGINGVCLARGLAGGRSLDGFRSLWIDEGDINTLVDAPVLHIGGRRMTKVALASALFHTALHDQDSPLDGDRMCRLLHDALAHMEPVSAPLVRADQRIDLFTTTTSVRGYETAIPTGLGTVAHTDRSYAQLMHFEYESGATSTLGDDDVPALAFAARATSSFPGAFAPVSLATFAAAIDGADLDRIADRFQFGLEFGASHHDQWYMDGGVLDNGPFDHAIDAIARHPAAVETAREMIYIEPDPGLPPGQEADAVPEPGVVSTVWSARVTIPQHTPLVSVLRGLQAMNTHIASVGAIVSAQMDPVLEALDRVTSGDFARPVDYEGMVAQAERVRTAAHELSGLGFATYCRLRAAAVADSIAESLAGELRFPPESNRSAFISSVVTEWTHERGAWKSNDPQLLDQALSPIDLPYRIRRAYFVLQAINQSLPAAGGAYRRQLLAMKRTAWDLLTELRTAGRAAAAAVHDAADHVFGSGLGRPVLADPATALDPKRFIEEGAFGAAGRLREIYANYVAALEATVVQGSSRRLWDVFQAETQDWPAELRRPLLARYVGFPIWDALVFPTIAAARLPQLSPIPVTRFSPLDATLLHPVDKDGAPRATGDPKLEGVGLAHFGGFFSRHAREHDYLWGRLDAAELILRLLGRRALPDGADAPPVDLGEHTRDAFTRILSAEAPILTELEPVLEALRVQVAR